MPFDRASQTVMFAAFSVPESDLGRNHGNNTCYNIIAHSQSLYQQLAKCSTQLQVCSVVANKPHKGPVELHLVVTTSDIKINVRNTFNRVIYSWLLLSHVYPI